MNPAKEINDLREILYDVALNRGGGSPIDRAKALLVRLESREAQAEFFAAVVHAGLSARRASTLWEFAVRNQIDPCRELLKEIRIPTMPNLPRPVHRALVWAMVSAHLEQFRRAVDDMTEFCAGLEPTWPRVA